MLIFLLETKMIFKSKSHDLFKYRNNLVLRILILKSDCNCLTSLLDFIYFNNVDF